MKIDKIKLTELEPAQYNPRQISDKEQQKLERNLNEFGLVDPIVINLKNNRIIGGHQRYHVLIKKKANQEFNLIRLGDIGWVFEDKELSIDNPNVEKALNISLNKLSGEWDFNKLPSLLTAIKDSDLDNDLTGFKIHEFELNSDDDDIIFTPDLFDMDKIYPTNTVKCPSCNHEFYED